ncbi:sensor histidine kinase [Anaeromyxobacter sp. Red801]|uniref:sensor histidine kinase n=1 Tax=Anaeromyxobacter sp. Red801 TaxID=3411632 RepID=UPI003BA095D3
MVRALAPLLAGLLGLAGALGATLALHRAASAALDRVLEERLAGAGATAAELLGRAGADPAALRAVMAANGLEGAYVVDRELRVLADATGAAGGRADLLRVDPARVARALRGEPSVAFAYAVGNLPVATGYFPVRGPDGAPAAALALEAGQGFAAARAGLRRALWLGVALSALAALALALAAAGFARAERRSAAAAARAARGEALATMAAMVAHEIRNPLGVIRGAAELVRARSGAALAPRDAEALGDVLGEVERLRRLTDDFLDLARDPAIAAEPADLAELAADAARALGRAHPAVEVALSVPPLRVRADAARVRQVLANLLENAALAGARRVAVTAGPAGPMARLEVRDDGPGVDAALRARLFEPFASGRARGAGLGLAISRRIAERHGGALELADPGPPGAAFALTLPLEPG